ncbi:unnamed protein product [Caenorhabditis angaria]|uniref:Uncharacterized protein n=1 Tax=Caenorhabditis angaria TaxID=860376 RepID=A0A9P1IYT1_9PELO|nr:unnamed protein product [Caenorhabditis angaria]
MKSYTIISVVLSIYFLSIFSESNGVLLQNVPISCVYVSLNYIDTAMLVITSCLTLTAFFSTNISPIFKRKISTIHLLAVLIVKLLACAINGVLIRDLNLLYFAITLNFIDMIFVILAFCITLYSQCKPKASQSSLKRKISVMHNLIVLSVKLIVYAIAIPVFVIFGTEVDLSIIYRFENETPLYRCFQIV